MTSLDLFSTPLFSHGGTYYEWGGWLVAVSLITAQANYSLQVGRAQARTVSRSCRVVTGSCQFITGKLELAALWHFTPERIAARHLVLHRAGQ